MGGWSDRYRNPDDDLPTDFDENRDDYYQALNLPLDADRFIADLQAEMREAVSTFNGGLKKNPYIRIGSKSGGWITLTPLDAHPAPPNLTALKTELNAIWPMTSLLDMVKETDLRLNFTDALKSPTSYETMERSVLQPRLLLCLHGLGTNAGLQRMAGLESGTTARDLAYVRRRHISVDAMRRAIAIVADGTLHARNPAIWGTGTTACASDSKHFGAWDQNLTTQWHVRYGGRGVMIYWHVERSSVHSLSAQVAIVVGSGVDDRGRDPSLVPRWRWIGSMSIPTARARSHLPSAVCWASSYCHGSRPLTRRNYIGLRLARPMPMRTCNRS